MLWVWTINSDLEQCFNKVKNKISQEMITIIYSVLYHDTGGKLWVSEAVFGTWLRQSLDSSYKLSSELYEVRFFANVVSILKDWGLMRYIPSSQLIIFVTFNCLKNYYSSWGLSTIEFVHYETAQCKKQSVLGWQ